MKSKSLILAMLALLPGCISVTAQSIQNDKPITKICIEHNPKVIVPNFTDLLQESFIRHGITSVMYDKVPDNCPYHLTYAAYQRWAGVMYMSNAHLDLYNKETIIGYADRHMPLGSAFDVSKWDSTQSKIDEMVDQLLTRVAP
jgi:hypothetical protein